MILQAVPEALLRRRCQLSINWTPVRLSTVLQLNHFESDIRVPEDFGMVGTDRHPEFIFHGAYLMGSQVFALPDASADDVGAARWRTGLWSATGARQFIFDMFRHSDAHALFVAHVSFRRAGGSACLLCRYVVNAANSRTG